MRNTKIWKNKVYFIPIKGPMLASKCRTHDPIWITLYITYALPLWPTLVDQFTYEAPRAHILPMRVINSLCLMCSVIIVFYFAFQNL